MQSFEIPGRLLGRNESEALARSHWSRAWRARRDEIDLISACIRAGGIELAPDPVDVAIVYHEAPRLAASGKLVGLRDADNVQGGSKPIMDALARCGIVPDDDPFHVRRVIPVVLYDGFENPHITVGIMDYEPRRRVAYPPVALPGEEG